MFIKGHKTSQVVMDVMNDLHAMKKPHAVKFNKKESNSTSLGPFDDEAPFEFFATKNDASLFAFATHSKKRAHNIVFARLFDYHVLDMIELGVIQYKSIEVFGSKHLPQLGSKPCFLLSGSKFKDDPVYEMIGNILVDFFRGQIVQEINLKGLDHVITLSVNPNGNIHLRHFATLLKKSGSRVPKVELEEIGPFVEFQVRRNRFGDAELRKNSLKVPPELKPHKEKLRSTNIFGDTMGAVHVQKQDYADLERVTKPVKALKEESRRKRKERNEEAKKEGDGEGAEPRPSKKPRKIDE
jgi:ribosome production factor 2